MTDNVVKFQPRPKATAGKFPAAAEKCQPSGSSGLFFEITLGDGRMELALRDSSGVAGTLKYDLTAVTPPDFDVDLVNTEWDRLREPPEGAA